MGLLLFTAVPQGIRAVEMTWEFSVQASASVQVAPARITLTWPQDQYMLPNSYTVYRKAPGDNSWGTGTTLPGTSTSYVDNNVVIDTPYEYQIVKVTSQYTGYGYLYAGINVLMTDSRGKLLLVVDTTYAGALADELAQLQQDLMGDGWAVVRLDGVPSDHGSVPEHEIFLEKSRAKKGSSQTRDYGHAPSRPPASECTQDLEGVNENARVSLRARPHP